LAPGCRYGPVVIAIFFVAAARYIFGHPHDGAAFFTRPFYDPSSWNTKAVLGGTSGCGAHLHLVSMASQPSRKKPRIRGETFFWLRCWFVS